MSNREIAQNLFITTRTVEGHLTHAYEKLAITSREQLPAALAPPAARPLLRPDSPLSAYHHQRIPAERAEHSRRRTRTDDLRTRPASIMYVGACPRGIATKSPRLLEAEFLLVDGGVR